jgi:UDP-N-acetylmuramate dehydrogenase
MADVLPSALLERIGGQLGTRARGGEAVARHTSYRIGGPADLLVLPDTAEELALVLGAAAAHGVPVTMLGGGSNVLVGDGGIRGVAVKLGRGFARVEWTGVAGGGRARAGAAVQLGQLCRAAAQRGLAGLEFAEGIPGSVGGAVAMNAGAYGGNLASVVDAVEGVLADGTRRTLAPADLAFDYRRAALPAGFVVTSVAFRLVRDDAGAIAARMEDVRSRRVAAQPHGLPNGGSVFKNPANDHAGRLIEAAGLKGARAGGARISDRHANFIVNEGRARAADVKALIEMAQRVVWERNGVWLEPELRFLGSW